MTSDTASYLIGRERATLPLPPPTAASEDKLFAAQRIDGQQLEGQRFYHCTFANISFKDTTLRRCEFLNCAFLNCYFRKAVFVNTAFVGSKFYDCDFPKLSIQSCDFKYAKFRACFIPKNEIEHSLPGEPNLREELANDLAQAADNLGHVVEARAYRLVAIAAPLPGARQNRAGHPASWQQDERGAVGTWRKGRCAMPEPGRSDVPGLPCATLLASRRPELDLRGTVDTRAPLVEYYNDVTDGWAGNSPCRLLGGQDRLGLGNAPGASHRRPPSDPPVPTCG
jgi:Pentapeptide repeats (9 copies)